MSPYRYGLLLPVRASGAAEHNVPLLGAATLGIEVTEPELAANCGLGNIDPQHDPEAVAQAPAAIELAVNWPLPPAGTLLVTLRPDADALGAMAIISMRIAGNDFSPATLQRVSAIAESDSRQRGAWPGPRPLPNDYLPDPEYSSTIEVAAIGALSADYSRPLEARVAAIAEWLSKGNLPDYALESVQARRHTQIQALKDGLISVRLLEKEPIALVETSIHGALELGYRLAPLVIAVDPKFRLGDGSPHRKATLAQWDKSHADFGACARILNAHEPGWGGTPTILGSPQGAGTSLSLHEIAAVVLKYG